MITLDNQEPPPSETRPKRPPRLDWITQDNPLYFLTCCTWNRLHILANEDVHAAFETNTHKALTMGIAVGRYVIMPDHIHLFVRIGQERKLGQFVKFLKESITKTIHLTKPEVSNIWQPGFFDHVLRSTESYSQKWAYVRKNPVRANLVQEPEDWKYQGEITAIHL